MTGCEDDDGNLISFQSSDNPETPTTRAYGYYNADTGAFTWDDNYWWVSPDQITPPKPVLPPIKPPPYPNPGNHIRIYVPGPCLPVKHSL